MDSFARTFIAIVMLVLLVFVLWRMVAVRIHLRQEAASSAKGGDRNATAKPNDGVEAESDGDDNTSPYVSPSQPRVQLYGRLLFRIPVYSSSRGILGYQLNLTESGLEFGASVADFVSAIAAYIAQPLLFAGKRLPRKIFLQVDAQPLDREALRHLPAEDVVLNFRPSTKVSLNVADNFHDMQEMGFQVAIPYDPVMVPLATMLPVSDFVWISLRKHKDLERMNLAMGNIRQHGAALLAEAVDSQDSFGKAHAMRFQGFEGPFFSLRKPLRPDQPMDSGTLRFKKIFNVLATNADPAKVEQVIVQDEAFTERILKYLNAPRFALAGRIETIAQAVTLLGHAKLMRWVLVTMLYAEGVRQQDASKLSLFISGLYRGRFIELALQRLHASKREQQDGFLVGLFSQMDQIMGYTMLDVLAELSLGPDVREALLNDAGRYFRFLELARLSESYDVGRLKVGVRMAELDDHAYNEILLQALFWAEVFARPPAD